MEPSDTSNNTRQSPMLPLAIVFGFGLIAVAIYFTGGKTPAEPTAPTGAQQVAQGSGQIAPITEDDYIRGDPNAPIVLVEYSDYDCPFCKSFHETMRQVMAEYGGNSEVAWVYRHFPLPQLHPNAPKIAEAAECVGELAGNQGFWTFSDLVFDEREGNASTNMTKLNQFAVEAGVEEAAFDECLSSGRHRESVQADYEDAINAGARGTPYTIVMVGDQQAPIKGAQPYGTVRDIIENLQAQISGVEARAENTQNTETDNE